MSAVVRRALENMLKFSSLGKLIWCGMVYTVDCLS